MGVDSPITCILEFIPVIGLVTCTYEAFGFLYCLNNYYQLLLVHLQVYTDMALLIPQQY